MVLCELKKTPLLAGSTNLLIQNPVLPRGDASGRLRLPELPERSRSVNTFHSRQDADWITAPQ